MILTRPISGLGGAVGWLRPGDWDAFGFACFRSALYQTSGVHRRGFPGESVANF